MGQLSDRSNTSWQLLHASPGSSHWSVVTPPGVADNGGLVGGVAQGSILLGFLPSGRLHFSPLSQSSDGGGSWDAAFLPGALAPVPDALAATASDNGRTLAIVVGPRTALQTGVALRQWSRLVSTTQLRRASPRCGASALNAVAFSPAGLPVVAAGCSGRGVVGIFTRRAGSWRLSGTVLHGALARANTSVLRLVSSGSTTTALVQATVINQRKKSHCGRRLPAGQTDHPRPGPRGTRGCHFRRRRRDTGGARPDGPRPRRRGHRTGRLLGSPAGTSRRHRCARPCRPHRKFFHRHCRHGCIHRQWNDVVGLRADSVSDELGPDADDPGSAGLRVVRLSSVRATLSFRPPAIGGTACEVPGRQLELRPLRHRRGRRRGAPRDGSREPAAPINPGPLPHAGACVRCSSTAAWRSSYWP